MISTTPFGKAQIKILGARDTLICDITTSDPYCLITSTTLEGTPLSQTYTTEVIPKTLNPVWDREEFIFDVTTNSTIIEIVMWDEDRLSQDDFMGQVRINLDEYKNKGSKDLWIPLEGKNPNKIKKKTKKPKKRGDIHVQICFYSFSSLANYLKLENHNIIRQLSKQLISDDFSKALMYYFSNMGNKEKDLIEIIRDLAIMEIESTENANVLFRTDSLPTKLIVAVMKTIGITYLKEVFSPLILNMIENDVKLEVDPIKGITEAESASNAIQLQHYCSSFLASIKANLDQLPLEFKLISNIIHEQVEKKFGPECPIKAVGGFFFLRFINPAIFSPDALQLISVSPNSNVRRALTLISKILQNMSNHLTFSNKETYLQTCNVFISSRFDEVSAILKHVSTVDEQHDPNPLGQPQLVIDHSTLMKHTDTIISLMLEKKQFINLNNSQFLLEIDSRYQLIQSQKKQESKKVEQKKKK